MSTTILVIYTAFSVFIYACLSALLINNKKAYKPILWTWIKTEKICHYQSVTALTKTALSPVESIEHLDDHQHWQRHSHGFGVTKNTTVHTCKHLILSQALCLVSLWEGGKSGFDQYRQHIRNPSSWKPLLLRAVDGQVE